MPKLEDLMPRPVDVNCPDAGAVSMLPYISHAAMDALLRWEKDPPRAVDAALAALVAGGAARLDTLSANDREALTRRVAQLADAESTFVAARASAVDAAHALMVAITQTQMWSEAHRSRDKWERTMRRFVDPIGLMAFARIPDAIRDILSVDEKYAKIFNSIRATSSPLAGIAAMELPRVLVEMDAAACIRDEILKLQPIRYNEAIQNLRAVGGLQAVEQFAGAAIAASASASTLLAAERAIAIDTGARLDHLRLAFDQVSSITGFLQNADEMNRAMGAARIAPSLLNAMRVESSRISVIAEPIPAVLRYFADAAAAAERARPARSISSLGEAFHLANEGLEKAIEPVALSNEFFSRPYALPEIALPKQLMLQPASTRPEAAVRPVSPATLVHRTTAEVIAAGNDIAVLMRARLEAANEDLGDAVEDRVREVLSPYLPLLDRIQRLNAPETLGTLLRRFATTLVREH